VSFFQVVAGRAAGRPDEMTMTKNTPLSVCTYPVCNIQSISITETNLLHRTILSMIINAKTFFLTLLLILTVGYVGLQLIRQFALSIALENHESNQANDTKEDAQRKKKIALADKAASDAFRKVEPLIKKNTGSRPSSPVDRNDGV
jgi:hypothetical protein